MGPHIRQPDGKAGHNQMHIQLLRWERKPSWKPAPNLLMWYNTYGASDVSGDDFNEGGQRVGPDQRLGDRRVDRQVEQGVQAHELDDWVGIPICTRTKTHTRNGVRRGGREKKTRGRG